MNKSKLVCTRKDHLDLETNQLRTDIAHDKIYKICQKCITSQQINGESIINLYEIASENPRLVMDNWPFFEKQSQIPIQNRLKEIFEIAKPFKEASIAQINKYYDEFQQQIMKAIDESKKQQNTQVLTLYEGFDNKIVQLYQELCKKEQFKILIDKLPEEYEDLEKFIGEMNNSREENTIKMNQEIDLFDQTKQLFCLDQPEKIKKHCLDLIKEINFFTPTNSKILDDCKLYTINNEEQQNDVDQEKIQNTYHNAEVLLKLIGNKSNFCSQKFLIQMENFLEKIEKNLNTFVDFSSVHIDKKLKPIDFSRVSLITLKQMIDPDEEGTDQNYVNLEIKRTSFQEKIEQSLLRNKFIQTKQIEGQSLFQKTSFEQSQNFLKITNLNSSILIEKVQQGNSPSTAVTTFNIDGNFMHIFRYKIVNTIQDANYLYAGLIKEQNIDNSRLQNEKKYQGSQIEHCFTKQLRGDDLLKLKNQQKNKYHTYEMRIHLHKNIIQLMDYPGYNNIVLIENIDFNPNDKYRFGFEFFNQAQGEGFELLYFDIIYQ